MDKYVVILACGKGSRMGTEIPKQYLLLDNKPVIFHTIERISQFDKNYKIIVVINKEHADLFSDLSKKYALSVPFLLVFGGDERYFSVKNALDVITNINSLVAIHDGVRPFADKEMFSRCFNEAERYGNAVCAMKATDSIRKGTENLNTALKRDEIFFVQTPQTFRTENIKKAYLQPFDSKFTDDASVVENMGEPIHITKGKRENIKITYPFDLVIAEKVLENIHSKTYTNI